VPVPAADTTRPPVASRIAAPAAVLRMLRPKQWIKNAFVIAPALFGRELGDASTALVVAAAVACFCAISSAVYLVNDVLDREEDRRHPVKRHRPVAAGLVSVRTALAAAGVLAALAAAGALALDPWFALVLGGYAVNATAYSLWVKHEVVLDVFSIAAGFVLRVVAGAVVVRVEPSAWILICTGLLALMLGFGKRRGELSTLQEEAAGHRAVLTQYSHGFLDAMLVLTGGATLTSYAVYTATGEPASRHLAATLPFVVYGVTRYLWLALHRHEGENPTALVWEDRALQVTLVLWAATAAVLLAVF